MLLYVSVCVWCTAGGCGGDYRCVTVSPGTSQGHAELDGANYIVDGILRIITIFITNMNNNTVCILYEQ